MWNRIADESRKVKNRIFAIFIWILTGLFVTLAGMAMIVSGSFNLDCFYDSGDVYEMEANVRNAVDSGLGYDFSQNCLVISTEDTIKTFDLLKTEKNWRYILLDLSKMNTDTLSCRADFYDNNNNCVAQQEYQLKSGKNVLEIQETAYSKVVFHFLNQYNVTFNIDKAQFRETFFVVSKKKILLEGTVIFGIYLLVTGLLAYFVRRKIARLDWYVLVHALQKLYCKAGDSAGSRICRNMSTRTKARLRTLLFCIMILNMQIASVLNLYENNRTYRYEMLANVAILLLVALLCWEKKLQHINWKNKLVGAWLTLWIMAIVSDLIVSKHYAYTGYMMLFVVGFLFFLWGNMEHRERLIWDFIHAIKWNFLINAMFCFMFRPYTPGYRYNGGSYSPGVWGMYLLFAWCAFLAELDYTMGQAGIKKRGLIALVGAGVTACFLWQTQSISSMLPALAVTLIFSLRWWICRKKKKVRMLLLAVAIFAGIVGLSDYGVYQIPRIVDMEVHFNGDYEYQPVTNHPFTITVEAASIKNSRIYQKLTQSATIETLTSSRNLYWNGYLRKMNLWGHVNKVILWGSSRKPHNGLLAIMYRYGIFAGIPYIVMILYNLVYSFRYLWKNRSGRGTNFFVLAVAIAGTMLLPVENLELPFYWLCWFAFYLMMGSYFEQDKGETRLKYGENCWN